MTNAAVKQAVERFYFGEDNAIYVRECDYLAACAAAMPHETAALATPVPGAVSNAMVERATVVLPAAKAGWVWTMVPEREASWGDSGPIPGVDFGNEFDPPESALSEAVATEPVAWRRVLRDETTEWAVRNEPGEVVVHSRMIDGVLCRWWGEGEPPAGAAKIDAALSSLAPVEAVATEPVAWQTAIERAYGILWRDVSRHSAEKSIAARKELLAVLTKDGQKRGIEFAIGLYGPTTEHEMISAEETATRTAQIWHHMDDKSQAGYGPWVRHVEYLADLEAAEAALSTPTGDSGALREALAEAINEAEAKGRDLRNDDATRRGAIYAAQLIRAALSPARTEEGKQ